MRFSLLLTVILISALSAARASAEPGSLGHRADVLVMPSDRNDCPGPPVCAHSGTFENAYCWHWGGTQPPYYGAFGEAYDEGPCIIMCAAFWLTQIGSYAYPPVDVYVWEGGITGEPGLVLWMKPGVVLGAPGLWPTVTQHDVRSNLVAGLAVAGEFTVGYYVDLSGSPCQFFVAVDEGNGGGHPWTNVAPGGGYPSGWQHPGVVWGMMDISLGIGVYLERGTSGVEDSLEGDAESATWGRIKEIFER